MARWKKRRLTPRDPNWSLAPPPKRGRGNPSHVPTDQTRAFARVMLADGKTEAQVSAVIGINEKTLRKYYGDEIATGGLKANASVSTSLFNNATGAGDWQKANITAAIWWDKTRNGKREPRQEVAHSGVVGSYDLSKVSDVDLQRVETILAPAVVAISNSGA